MIEVLVTGARGYIGGRLVERLARNGFRVRAGSRGAAPSRGDAEGSPIEVGTDFDSTESLAVACRGCDAVVHLASLNEVDCAVDPEAATLVNTIYTQRLARVAASMGVRQFIYFSTVHVYGSPLAGRIAEDTPAAPAHPYSISHKAAEDYLKCGYAGSGMATTILRLSNSFGFPASKEVNRWTLVANDAARQLATTGKVALKTPGTQLRDFITLTDVCRAVEFLLKRDVVQGSCEIYNLGEGRSASILELVSRVSAAYASLTGHTPVVERPEAPAVPRGNLNVDIGKLSALGFVLERNADEELMELVRRCLVWFGPTAKGRA
jgi:UDP-glucose 4-epimerase